jgi:hypothetical protein
MTDASQKATTWMQQHAETAERNSSARSIWQQEMSNVQLGIDFPTIESEIALLLEGSVLPGPNGAASASSRNNLSDAPKPEEPPAAHRRRWTERLLGTWHSRTQNGHDDNGPFEDSWTLTLRSGGEGLLGTLQTFRKFELSSPRTHSLNLTVLLSLNVDGGCQSRGY